MKTKNALRGLASAAVLQFGLFATLAIASAQTTVTNLADSGPGTLRQVISNAQPGDTITFDPALAGQTNVLTSGELLITNNLTIDASALPGGFHISGNHYWRVFEVAANTVVTLDSLTIQDGYIRGDGGGIYVNSGAGLTTKAARPPRRSPSPPPEERGKGGGGRQRGLQSQTLLGKITAQPVFRRFDDPYYIGPRCAAPRLVAANINELCHHRPIPRISNRQPPDHPAPLNPNSAKSSLIKPNQTCSRIKCQLSPFHAHSSPPPLSF
jgi:hypothetical protein